MFNPPKLYNKNDNKKFLIQLKRVYYILFFNFSIVAIEKERKKIFLGLGSIPGLLLGGSHTVTTTPCRTMLTAPKKKIND